MAGLYLHIPFCKSRCIYCGFYSTTSLSLQSQYTEAICKEMTQRKDYITNHAINTIYLGGGTPSQLSFDNLQHITHYLYNTYNVKQEAEFTIEVNPDDVNNEFIHNLKQLPINRISIGIQTFNDKLLKLIRRRHTASQAKDAIKSLKDNGFNNISIDLMFGFPNETIQEWENDIQQAIELDVQHISAYSLMFEEGTPLYAMLTNGKVEEIEEEKSLQMYQILIDRLSTAGYTQYEISNFCKSGYHSRHNSNYWNNTPYIGIGAAAHSFDGTSRQWNIDNLTEYIDGINNNKRIYEIEELTTNQKYNERIMTRLRTMEGLNLNSLIKEFGKDKYDYCIKAATKYIDDKKLYINKDNNNMALTRQGLFISNQIMSDLMYV